MKVHVLIKNHLGNTSPVLACGACARSSTLPPLRHPGTGERDSESGLLLAGPPVVRESGSVRCDLCGVSDACVGYLRACAHCSRFALLDHAGKDWPLPAWFCSRPDCRKAERAYRGCCDTCGGTGKSYDPDTNGLCWDCRGTGHPHDGKCS